MSALSMSAIAGKSDNTRPRSKVANGPKRTSFGLRRLGDCRPHLIREPFSRIVKLSRRTGCRHSALEQNSAETSSLRGFDRRSTALLPVEDDGGFRHTRIDRLAYRNAAGFRR